MKHTRREGVLLLAIVSVLPCGCLRPFVELAGEAGPQERDVMRLFSVRIIT